MTKFCSIIRSRMFIFLSTTILFHIFTSYSFAAKEITISSNNNQRILITPQIRQNPSTLKIDITRLKKHVEQNFILYHHSGIKIFEKIININDIEKNILTGDKIFGDKIDLTSGFYFYEFEEYQSPTNAFNQNDLRFIDVSQTYLPGDSTGAAFTEFVDVTGDSLPDIILGIHKIFIINFTQPQIFINNGNGFFSNETNSRFPQMNFNVNDIIIFDLDLDGDLDIYFAADDGSPNTLNKDKIFLNNGQGFFSEVSSSYLPQLTGISNNVEWGFINNDQYPDLLISYFINDQVTPYITPLFLLINDGNGYFTNQSTNLPQTKYNLSDPLLLNVNNDSLTDIVFASLGDYVLLDTLSGQNGIFIQNSDETFSDETSLRMPDIHRWSKLLKVTDINNDNALDLYSINIGFYTPVALNVLYVNDKYGYFTDETNSRLPSENEIWNNDGEFTDFDNNGFYDLFMINVVPGGPAFDNLFFNDSGYFIDQSQHLPSILDFNVSSSLGDFDNDNDDDIFISVASGTSEIDIPDILYQNTMQTSDIYFSDVKNSKHYYLKNNYPNPFNGTTIIEFSLPRTSFIELYIYDLRGKKIKTLTNQTMNKGMQKLNWDGKNDSGISVSSGLYLYSLKVNDFQLTKKLLYLK